MKIVIAIDSLKGSLSSMEAGNAIKEGVLKVSPEAQVLVKPLADGGEGTTEALSEGLGGEMVQVEVHGPMDVPVTAAYGWIRENKTAVMEMAAAAGITLVGKEKQPLHATTYGVGEMIRDAVKRGCRNFVIGIGGSATNDCGIGMLTALGFEFLDASGNPVGIDADALKDVERIRTDHVMPELEECSFRVACDVTNPLCGPNGATFIYGPQKGVTEEMKEKLDQDLGHFAEVTKRCLNADCADMEGAGAAGGLGYAFMAYLKADLRPGIDLVLEAVDMDEAMKGADLVFTGEGRLDHQTAMGKAPVGIAALAKKHGAAVIAFAGSVADGAEACNEKGIDAYFPILRQVVTLDEAMEPQAARRNMTKTAEQVMRLVRAVKK